MKYLMIFESNRNAPPPSPDTLATIEAHTKKMLASGKVVLTGGLVRPTHGIKIKSEGGKVTVTDGPFAESKELIDGFAVVNASNQDEAVALFTEFIQIAGDGRGEMLPIFD